MEQHGNQFHHQRVSEGRSNDNDPQNTHRLQSDQDVHDENRKRPTNSDNSSVSSQSNSTSNDPTTCQISKKRKLRMGPQECLEYSSTPQGASALTNPQGVSKSSKDINEKLYPVQRGRSHGSCFISTQEQSQLINRKSDHVTSTNIRQYVSPSRGAGVKLENEGSVYDSSGLALIGGSPSQKHGRKGNQFALNSSQLLAGNPGKSFNKSAANNFQRSTNVWKKSNNSSSPSQSPPTQRKFGNQASGKVFSSQGSTLTSKPSNQEGRNFSKNSYQSQDSIQVFKVTVSPNKWKKTSGIVDALSPSKDTCTSFQGSPPNKMQLNYQSAHKLSEHPTKQKKYHKSSNQNQGSVSSSQVAVSPNKWKKTSGIVDASSPSKDTSTLFQGSPPNKMKQNYQSAQKPSQHPTTQQQYQESSYQSQGNISATQFAASPNKWKKTSGISVASSPSKGTSTLYQGSPDNKMQLNHQSAQKVSQPANQQQYHAKQNVIQSAVPTVGNSPKKVSAIQPSQFRSARKVIGVSSQLSQTAKQVNISPKKQTLVTDFYSKSPPKDTGSKFESGMKASVKRDLNQTWGSNMTLVKSPAEQTDKLITPQEKAIDMEISRDDRNRIESHPKQSPYKIDLGWNLKAEDDCSNLTEPSCSQTSSTGSCNLTSLSIKSEDELKSKDDESMSEPLSSSQTLTVEGEDYEDDCIEDLMKDYEIDEKGRLRLSQSSSGRSENRNLDNLEVKVENQDLDDEADSSDEGQLFLKSLHDEGEPAASLPKLKEEGDTNIDQFQKENVGRENQSASQVNISPKKELPSEGTNSSALGIVQAKTEQDFPCSSGSVAKTGSQLPTELEDSSSHDDTVEFGDMPDEEEFPEELLAQIEAGEVVDDIALKERTFGLVGNGNDEDVDEENRDFFSILPVEVIENILCRIPIVDLMLSCSRVCHKWANIISNEAFIPWKKSYSRCKAGCDTWISPLKNSKKESCLIDVIRFLSTLNRKPSDTTATDLQKHSNYEFARDLIAENLPDLIKDGSPHPWSCVAALVVMAETVDDVQEIFRCLLNPSSGNTPTTVTEIMYCLATLLLTLQREHNLCRRLHFRVFYALFLFENDTKPSSVQLEDDNGDSRGKKNRHHSIAGKIPLTHEQLRIVNHKLDREKNEVIKVVAFAGTGKTTTLIKFAEANIYCHLLYVAFNKSVQVEAAKMFPGNTECRTSHSIAFEKLRHKYGRKIAFDLKPDIINDLIPTRPKGEKSPLQWALYARLVGETLKSFMSSADEFITTKHVPMQYSTASVFHRPLTHHDRMSLLKDAEYLWERMIDERDNEAKITHDGYFKVYQLSKPVITDVQCLLIDEAQDLTPAQQDVLLSQPLPKILVGDPHQQIYSFRGATNAMDAIQADKVYHLTQSFRFGSEIALMANCVLDVYKDMTEHTIVGKEEEGTLCGEEIGQKAIICRGNLTVFTQAVKLCDMEGHEKLRLGFTGFGEGKSCKSGFNFEKLMELYKMSAGASGWSLQNPLFKKMNTFLNLEAYAVNAEDSELLALISIVKMYNHRIPELVQKIKSKTAKELQFATVVLTTAHKSKGLEFDTVQLADDFKMFVPRVTMGDEGMLINDDVSISEDEKNLIYVAVTRTKKSLRLNEGLRKCLGKASEHFKFPIPTKQFLECPHSIEEQRCLDCGQPITKLKRVTMSKVWSVKLVSSTQHENHATNSGGFICSGCSYHHLPGFEKFFLGDQDAPLAASIM